MKRNQKALHDWLLLIEQLIPKYSTKPRTRGKYKGHSSTDAVGWVQELAELIERDIRRSARGSIAYDENMSLARDLGAVLVVWYSLVHRAKSYDDNRPLKSRRRANRAVTDFRSRVLAAMTSDQTMAKVWRHQRFSPPYGKGAKGGTFV